MKRVTEEQYILVSNLQRLRMAEHAMHLLTASPECPEAELKEANKILAVMRQRCEASVDPEHRS